MLDSLSVFVRVCELGTFTLAARAVHLSQPAVSASIRRLEEQVGARLLDRGPGGATPTAAGRALLPRAKRALSAVDEGMRAVGEVMGLQAGEVRLGAGPTSCTYLLPDDLAAYRRAYPGIRLLLREAHAPAVWEGVADGSLDMGIVTAPRGLTARSGLTVELWRTDPLVLVRAPDSVADPLDHITFPKGSALREMLDRAFPEVHVIMELGSIAAVKGNVRAGVGTALVSSEATARDIEEGRLVKVEDPRVPYARTLVLVHRGEEGLPPAAAALRRQLLGRVAT